MNCFSCGKSIHNEHDEGELMKCLRVLSFDCEQVVGIIEFEKRRKQ